MFIDDEVPLQAGLDAARAGLANLAVGDGLTSASEDAYGEGVTELIRVGPLGSVPGTSKLVQVRFQNLTERDGYAGLAVRWEATGPGGGLFPALDANVTVTAAGERITILRLAGSYRPPLGTVGEALDTAILHRVATATIRTFLNDIAAAITRPHFDDQLDLSSETHGFVPGLSRFRRAEVMMRPHDPPGRPRWMRVGLGNSRISRR